MVTVHIKNLDKFSKDICKILELYAVSWVFKSYAYFSFPKMTYSWISEVTLGIFGKKTYYSHCLCRLCQRCHFLSSLTKKGKCIPKEYNCRFFLFEEQLNIFNFLRMLRPAVSLSSVNPHKLDQGLQYRGLIFTVFG
jgi:hypothetical protein